MRRRVGIVVSLSPASTTTPDSAISVLLLVLGCTPSADQAFRLTADELHADGNSARIDDRDALLDIALVDGAEKQRRFDVLTVEPDVTAASLAKTVHSLLYAGSRKPVEVGDARFLTNRPLPETCDVPVLLVDDERVMHLRIPDAENGYVEAQSTEALTIRGDVACGPIEPRSNGCSRGLLVATPKTRWSTLSALVDGDWSLFAMPMPEGLNCSTSTGG